MEIKQARLSGKTSTTAPNILRYSSLGKAASEHE